MPVFHLDIEAFVTTVERVKDTDLRGCPLVIAPRKARATALAASPDAKALGIRRHMPVDDVRKYFPDVCIKPPDFELYDRANRCILEIVNQFSPVVEPVRYGHIALDMTGMRKLYGNLENAALKLGREIRERTTLPTTVGIAANKLVSTIAAKEIQKNHEPLYQVGQGDEAPFLAPLTSKALPEWEFTDVRKLMFELNLARIRQIQVIPCEMMGFAAGAAGLQLHRHAMGIDPRPVTPATRARTLNAEHTFNPDTNDDGTLRAMTYQLLEGMCFQLRARTLSCDHVNIDIKYSDDMRDRKRFAFAPTQDERIIHKRITKEFDRIFARRRRVRYLHLTLDGLHAHDSQPDLFEQPPETKPIDGHLDQLRRRFGTEAIRSGRSLGGHRAA